MANEKLRGYRRGIPYRTGDVKEDVFLKEFKFKGIEYGAGYAENDKKRYLNYTYDALKDLSAILNMPSKVVSLLNKENEKPALYFGEANKGHTNFIVNKDGTIVRNWVYFLDKFLATKDKNIGLFNLIDSEETDAQAARNLINTLKYKEKEIDKSSLTSDKLEQYKNELQDLIDSMPFMKSASLDVIATVEDSRSRFLKEFSEESLDNMISVFESHGLGLGDLKSKLLELLNKITQEYNLLTEAEKSDDLVLTDFYQGAENRDKKEGLNKYTTNLELFVSAVELYIQQKLKATSCYNNFLMNPNELDAISLSATETPIILGAVENFFNEVLPPIIEQLNIEDEVVEDVVVEKADEVDETVANNIDKVLSEDKGKFKLTLFKKLAKEIGLKVDQSRSEKTEAGVYYIYFTEGYVKYIKPAVYNNPNQKNHCINIYCGENGDSKQGYWWDNELNYNDLVNYLVNIENEHRKEVAKTESKKVKKELDKFKLTEFKVACGKMNLTVDKSETPIVDKKYIIRFGNRNYITYMAAPVHFDSTSNKEHKIKIKTMREEVYHSWVGKLEYKALLENILKIEQEGQVALKEEKAEMQRKIEQVEKEKQEMINLAQKTKAEYDKVKAQENKQLNAILDCSDVMTTKDLRDKMAKYIQMSRISLGYPANVNNLENVLKTNVNNIDNQDLIIERTVIPDKKLKGNSKSWSKAGDNCILLQNRADNRKQLEGLIEGFVDMKLSTKNYSKIEKQMYRESLTFMLCKVVGLDVRTYCNSDLFERYVKSGNNVSSYLSKSFKLLNNLLVYFK